jgi:hypothetical protein
LNLALEAFKLGVAIIIKLQNNAGAVEGAAKRAFRIVMRKTPARRWKLRNLWGRIDRAKYDFYLHMASGNGFAILRKLECCLNGLVRTAEGAEYAAKGKKFPRAADFIF